VLDVDGATVAIVEDFVIGVTALAKNVFNSDVIGNVRSFLERKATDFNQNQSSGQYPLLKEGLQRPAPILVPTTTNLLFVPAGSFPNTRMTFGPPRNLLQSSLLNRFITTGGNVSNCPCLFVHESSVLTPFSSGIAVVTGVVCDFIPGAAKVKCDCY
jgi:hypothetical protein